MKKNTRALAAWLCTLLVIPTVMSCADTSAEQTGADTQKADTTAQAVTVDPTQAAMDAAIAKMQGSDFGGYEFRIMDRSDEHNPVWETIDVWSEAESGDTINDAIYRRNRLLEENLNIQISENKVKFPHQDARKAIMTGDDVFDVFTDGLSDLSTLAVEGFLVDLHLVDGLKLTESWWDQDMNSGLSIANKLFFCTGDISIMDNYGTWCVMFNKDIAGDYDLENIYDHVRAGTWTLPLMYSMAKQVSKDLDGNGVQDETDQWGFLTESYNEYGLWAAGGQSVTGKDENDLPVLTAYNEKSVEIIDLVSEFTHDSATTLIADRVTKINFNDHYAEGNALFIYGGMWLITMFRGYDINFGVVPAPKFEESQTRYYNTYSYTNCTAYSVPTTSTDLARTGSVMEAMAEVSKYTLTPAYYDVNLIGQSTRDEESAEMLDIIFGNRVYDIGYYYQIGPYNKQLILMLRDYQTNFTSMYDTYKNAAEITLGVINNFYAEAVAEWQ